MGVKFLTCNLGKPLGYFRKKPNDKLTYANGADHDEVSDVNMTNRVGGL